jgi:hypothetical protein
VRCVNQDRELPDFLGEFVDRYGALSGRAAAASDPLMSHGGRLQKNAARCYADGFFL